MKMPNTEKSQVIEGHIDPAGDFHVESNGFQGDTCMKTVKKLFDATDDNHQAEFKRHVLVGGSDSDRDADIHLTSR